MDPLAASALVPISEAKGRLSEIVRASDQRNVLLMRHGRPAAVVMSARRYEELMARVDDLEDRLSVYEREGVTISLDALKTELGLDEDSGPARRETRRPKRQPAAGTAARLPGPFGGS